MYRYVIHLASRPDNGCPLTVGDGVLGWVAFLIKQLDSQSATKPPLAWIVFVLCKATGGGWVCMLLSIPRHPAQLHTICVPLNGTVQEQSKFQCAACMQPAFPCLGQRGTDLHLRCESQVFAGVIHLPDVWMRACCMTQYSTRSTEHRQQEHQHALPGHWHPASTENLPHPGPSPAPGPLLQ